MPAETVYVVGATFPQLITKVPGAGVVGAIGRLQTNACVSVQLPSFHSKSRAFGGEEAKPWRMQLDAEAKLFGSATVQRQDDGTEVRMQARGL